MGVKGDVLMIEALLKAGVVYAAIGYFAALTTWAMPNVLQRPLSTWPRLGCAVLGGLLWPVLLVWLFCRTEDQVNDID